MSRIEFLKLKLHSQLGNITLNFSDKNEIENTKPYQP